MIKFTIAIPAYKKKFLSEAIESCLDQTYRDFELIVVNDHSPEDLDSVISHYDDPRIRYYVNDKNFGAVNVVDNWNRCLEYATGDYFICMGDDDRLLPCCLEEYSNLARKYHEVKVYHAWTELIDAKGCLYMFQEQRPEWESAYAFLWQRWAFRYWQFVGDFCYHTDTLRKKGGFFKQPLAWSSDDITAFRAALDAGIANTQVPCFQYRSNDQTISSKGCNETKIKALLLARNWYSENLNTFMPLASSDDTDTEYYNLLRKSMNGYFKKRFFWTLNDALRSKGCNISHMIDAGAKFGIARHDVIKEIYNHYMMRIFRIGNSY